jgi:glucose-1-phosphate adenylyltransferase
MDNCDIGRRAKVRGAILDKNVKIAEDSLIGYDLEADRVRGYHITDSGLVVIAGERSHVDITGLVV